MLFIYLFIYLSPNNISYKKCYRISRLITAVGIGVSNTSPLFSPAQKHSHLLYRHFLGRHCLLPLKLPR